MARAFGPVAYRGLRPYASFRGRAFEIEREEPITIPRPLAWAVMVWAVGPVVMTSAQLRCWFATPNEALAAQMLQRVLEPEVMDTAAEAIDYDAMDHSAVNRLFVTDFLFAAVEAGLPVGEPSQDEDISGAGSPSPRPSPVKGEGGKVAAAVEILDLGTGTAQIPIELCRRAPSPRVTAVDLAAEMLEVAKMNVKSGGLADRIRLERIDAKRLPYRDGQFDAVISNSIVHHIPQPAGALAEAVRVVRTGGLLFIRDLLRPPDEATLRRLVETYAAACNAHQRKMFDDSLRAALDLDEIRALVADLGFGRESVKATSDRHWTFSAVKQSPTRRT
jgi:ubiquinone/menaquinone biosynthesis C-methylase UbiE